MRRATAPRGLLLADENLDGRPVEIPVLAQLILQESAVRFLDPLRQVAEEGERGHTARRKLGDILDLDVLSLPGGRRRLFDDRKHDLV